MRPDKIKPFVEGEFDTPWSAERINELVRVCNMFLSLRAGEGIKITKSDDGPLIELVDPPKGGFTEGGDGSTIPPAVSGQQTL